MELKMADLIGTEVAKNYQKVSPSSMFGTRDLAFLKITADNVGTSKVDFRRQKYAILTDTTGELQGSFLDADSYFSRAIRALQGFAEVFFIGEPDETEFLVAVSSDTVNDGETDFSYIQDYIAGALGVCKKAPTGGVGTAYNGAISVEVLKAEGGQFI